MRSFFEEISSGIQLVVVSFHNAFSHILPWRVPLPGMNTKKRGTLSLLILELEVLAKPILLE